VIRWMLTRMEKSPSAVFYEKELAERFPNEFEQAKREKLLRHVETSLDGGSYALGRSRPLTVVSVGGKFEAFDDEDPEFDPVELALADLARWRLDLEALAKRFQQTNRLTGTPDTLDDRLLFIGGTARDGLALAFLLGLFHEHRSALTHLRALPSSLPSRHDRFVVACPTFTPTPFEQRELESLNIFVVPVNERDPFVLDFLDALQKPVRRVPRVILSDDEEGEFAAGRFKSRLPIHITGRFERRTGNVVEVPGAEVVLTDSPFELFLRLVIALHESEDGFVRRGSMGSGGGLVAEGFYTEESIDQAVSRLRTPFRAALHDVAPTEFIEVRAGCVRLSTHRRYVTWDREELLRHPNKVVRELAQRLLRTTKVGSSGSALASRSS